MRPEVLPWCWSCQDAFYLFCKGGVSSICRLTCCMSCDGERDACAQSLLSADFSLGVSCMPFFSDGCDTLACGQNARHFTDGAALRKAERRCGLCTGASQVPPSVFHSAEAVAHGNAQGPSAAAPHSRRREQCALEALHTFPEVIRAVCRSLALSHQGCWSLFATPMVPNTQGMWLAGQGTGNQGIQQ